MTADASDAKKYSTSLSSSGMNSDVLSDRGISGTSRGPCGRCSNHDRDENNHEYIESLISLIHITNALDIVDRIIICTKKLNTNHYHYQNKSLNKSFSHRNELIVVCKHCHA